MRRVFATVAAIALAVVAWGVISPTHRPEPTVSESVVPVAFVQSQPDGAMASAPIPSLGDIVGVTWEGRSPDVAEIRFERGGRWSDWVQLVIDDEHAPDVGTTEAAHTRGASEPTAFRDAARVQVRVVGGEPSSMSLSFVDVTRQTSGNAPAAVADVAIHTRAEWDPENQCPPRRTPEEVQVDIAFVHHTGIDRAYSMAEVPDILLGYCLYHRNTRGWDDIAYNFLIDDFGRIWEGRAGGTDRGIRGGHTKGFNSYSTGIALIGNYTRSAPGITQQYALTDLLSWKFGVHNIDPMSRTTVISQGSSKWPEGASVTLNAISGHRDAQATACPGIYCYNLLGQFRSVVDANDVTTPTDTYVAPTSGDFNGDGSEDGLVMRSTDSTWTFTDGSTGTVTSWGAPIEGMGATMARAVDLNGDAFEDLVVAGSSHIAELVSSGDGLTGTATAISAEPVALGQIVTAEEESTFAVLSNGQIVLGPDFSSVGSVANALDAAAGDLDGDGIDELAIVRGGGDVVIVSQGGTSPLGGTVMRVQGADRIVAGRFTGGGMELAAVDSETGTASLLRAVDGTLDVVETMDLGVRQSVSAVVVASSGTQDRLVVLDSYIGEWKEAHFAGPRSYVTTLEDQSWRTHVTIGDRHAADSFMMWYAREFGWMRTTFGYGQDADTNATTRISGASRFDTNVALSQWGFEGAAEAVIATGSNFPDALAAGVVAARLGGPLLVTDTDVLPATIADEIVRLGVDRVTIAGGPVAVSDAVSEALVGLGVEVRRIGGANRYETAALLSQSSFESADVVFVATGLNFPDALAGVPAAVLADAPILLVSDVVPASTLAELERLGPGTIKILGGPAAVSADVEDDLRSATGATIVRLGGANRYETARIVSQDTFGGGVDHVFLATGESYLDALIAGPVASGHRAPVLLSRDTVPDSVYDEIDRLRPDRIILVGGAMTAATASSLDGIGPSSLTVTVAWLPR